MCGATRDVRFGLERVSAGPALRAGWCTVPLITVESECYHLGTPADGAHYASAKRNFGYAPVVRATNALSEIRTYLRHGADRPDRYYYRLSVVEPDAENPAQHRGDQFRSDR